MMTRSALSKWSITLLTLEHSFCKACWSEGRRTKLIHHELRERDTVHPLTLRARVLRHYREQHPNWKLKGL